MGWKLGVDIGGTFTDIAAIGPNGDIHLWKEDTTPDRLGEAIEKGLAALALKFGWRLEEFLGQVEMFVHGSTVATNTLIERSGPLAGLICTAGFRDALYFRDGYKWDRYNYALPRPKDLVDRRLRVGVDERVAHDGSVVRPLDRSSVVAAAGKFRDQGVETVAVALLWAHVNPVHERAIRDILREELPGVPVLLSSEILPEIGEWIRTSATVLSAYVYPRSATYLESLAHWLTQNGLRSDFLVMQINGGCARVDQVLRRPVSIINSGPAAAPVASRYIMRRVARSDSITVDMGGTSFEASLMRAGEVQTSRAVMVAHQPLGIPAVDVASIGAGGGSIAWIDDGGALRVGPQSAGAKPGPAAYDRGGVRPTVTDANIVLGYLSVDRFLGGRRKLRHDLAMRAVEQYVGRPLGIRDANKAAAGIIRIVDENMVGAIRAVTVERGVDPRPCLLIAGGGAGALHASRLARALGITRVLVPNQAGALSAFGMTVTDVRHDYSATLHITSDDPQFDRVQRLLDELERDARAELKRSGFADANIRIERSVDARYVGQVHELITPIQESRVDADGLARLTANFHSLHKQRFTYSLAATQVEFLHWRVTGVGVIDQPGVEPFADVELSPGAGLSDGTRRAYFADLGGTVDVPIFDSARMTKGAEIIGPAFIDSATTTIVVMQGDRLVADGKESYLIDTSRPGSGGDPQ